MNPGETTFDTAVLYERGNRPVMEDRYILFQLNPYNLYGGVYDGHGGNLASEYACVNLPNKFCRSLLEDRTAIESAFLKSYRETDSEIVAPHIGTTAIDFFLEDGVLHYAYAGDSRLIIIKDSKALQLTFDHRVFDPKEAERVKALDAVIDQGYVVMGDFAIQPTRSLGNQYFKKAGVIAEPVVGAYTLLPSDKWIIAGTDGLFDRLKNDRIAEIISDCRSSGEACESLKHFVLSQTMHSDNVSAVVVKLK